jgi:hypothetical protein
MRGIAALCPVSLVLFDPWWKYLGDLNGDTFIWTHSYILQTSAIVS